MIRAFVDTSVLFSALYSASGHARDLLIYASTNQLKLVVTKYILDELDVVLKRRAQERYHQLRIILDAVEFEIIAEPTEPELMLVGAYVADPKDAPIVAGAIKANVDYLVTFDRNHILTDEVIAKSGLQIVAPKTIVEKHFKE